MVRMTLNGLLLFHSPPLWLHRNYSGYQNGSKFLHTHEWAKPLLVLQSRLNASFLKQLIEFVTVKGYTASYYITSCFT